MANPLFETLGNNPAPVNNGFMEFVNQFNQFKNTFRGNPRQVVENLLNSGQMSQAQFNKFSQIATQLMGVKR